MPVRAIRGAITIDSDTPENILEHTRDLLVDMLELNRVPTDDLVSILFSATPDISSIAPAVAARDLGLTEIPLLCLAEMPVSGSLPLCIRIMIHAETTKARSEIIHCFRRGAKILRPDLADSDHEPGRSGR